MTVAQFIAKRSGLGQRHARRLVESKQVVLNGVCINDGRHPLGKFDRLVVADELIQADTRRILLLHKPAGVLSATRDLVHRTVMDLVEEPWAGDLHLAGRLDRSSTGLVILTNDSAFSESLTRPGKRVPKTYLVETDQAISGDAVADFRAGMPFAKERRRSQPAVVAMLSERSCRLTIFEGLHHQIKRMFLRHGIRVTRLHRESIGPYQLGDLEPAEWRQLDL